MWVSVVFALGCNRGGGANNAPDVAPTSAPVAAPVTPSVAPAPDAAAVAPGDATTTTDATAAVTGDATAPAAPGATGDGPAEVARRYLELGGRGDLDGARALVVEPCRGGSVGDVSAVQMMGSRMTLSGVETSVASEEGDQARVRYTVRGSVHSRGGTATVLGMRVRTGALNIDGARQSGTLSMAREGGRWLVTCREATRRRRVLSE
ncbi:MAG: hypothetical protein HY909_31505 [Deltaproteobacteria bacterium]|nr:hypothetical protein [Deltaproteobacteria bacterium]